jgi:hypothetical protein
MEQTQKAKIEKALSLIKQHITEKETQQNRDLHQAVQLIVDVARYYEMPVR